MDLRPAVLAVVLQAGNAGAEERCEFAAASRTLALVTQLVVKNVRLHFNLRMHQHVQFTIYEFTSEMAQVPITVPLTTDGSKIIQFTIVSYNKGCSQ